MFGEKKIWLMAVALLLALPVPVRAEGEGRPNPAEAQCARDELGRCQKDLERLAAEAGPAADERIKQAGAELLKTLQEHCQGLEAEIKAYETAADLEPVKAAKQANAAKRDALRRQWTKLDALKRSAQWRERAGQTPPDWLPAAAHEAHRQAAAAAAAVVQAWEEVSAAADKNADENALRAAGEAAQVAEMKAQLAGQRTELAAEEARAGEEIGALGAAGLKAQLGELRSKADELLKAKAEECALRERLFRLERDLDQGRREIRAALETTRLEKEESELQRRLNEIRARKQTAK